MDHEQNMAVPDGEFDAGVSGFNGTVTRRSIGRLQVSKVAVTGTQTLRRTPALIARCTRFTFLLIRMRTGQGALRHRGGELPLRADECVLLDGREPFEISFQDGSESLWFHLPIDCVEGCLPDPQVAVAVALGGRPPCAGMLRDVMDTIYADQDPTPSWLVSSNLCTALALSVDAIQVRSTAHLRRTFKALQQTVSELASTCHVSVAQIAEAHGISLRHLHAVYSANGTTCSRELMRVRLERARRLLLDPNERGRSIDDIAWQCGFSDAGHFRRRFRALFGTTPSTMRTDRAVATA